MYSHCSLRNPLLCIPTAVPTILCSSHRITSHALLFPPLSLAIFHLHYSPSHPLLFPPLCAKPAQIQPCPAIPTEVPTALCYASTVPLMPAIPIARVQLAELELGLKSPEDHFNLCQGQNLQACVSAR